MVDDQSNAVAISRRCSPTPSTARRTWASGRARRGRRRTTGSDPAATRGAQVRVLPDRAQMQCMRTAWATGFARWKRRKLPVPSCSRPTLRGGSGCTGLQVRNAEPTPDQT